MTESEAKTKWCPMVRNENPTGESSINDNNEGASACIASECMMWRKQYRFQEHTEVKVDAGYCGLAGAPY